MAGPIKADTNTVATAPIHKAASGDPGLFRDRVKQHFYLWKAWSTKGAYSIADLGLASAANFGINILLARGLPAREYGAFSVAYAILLVAMGFQTSYIFEPMSVLGPHSSIDSVKQYRDSVFWLNLMLTLALSGVLAISGGLAGHNTLARTLVSCAMSAPFIMGFAFLRRVYYVDSNASAAALSSLIYAITLMGLAVCLRAAHYLSTESAIVGMGIASLVASVHSYRRYFGAASWCLEEVRRSAREHWHFGKFPVAAGVLSMGSSTLQTFLVAFSLGLGAAGVLRAMQNLVTPAQQLISALGIFIIPVLSRDISCGRAVSAHRKAAMYLTIVIAMTSLYAASLLIFRAPLEALIYGGKFKQYLWLLPLNGMIPVVIALTSGFSVLLRANRKPQHLLTSAVAGCAVGLASALPLSHIWGVWGAVASVLLANVAVAITTAWYYFTHRRTMVLSAG
jgi:O-antigen/teichoic acid export membrane protein